MVHNLVAVSLQFPQLIVNPNYKLRSKCFVQHKKKHYYYYYYSNFICFALKKNNSNIHHQNPPIFSLKFSSFHPLSESPQASFDDYIEDEARLLRATFSGKSERINQDDWRVEMPSFQMLFFKVSPVADVRLSCKSCTKDSPVHIPHNVSRFIDLQLMGWELKGLSRDLKKPKIRINVKGAIYAERTKSKSVLTNNLLLNVYNLAPQKPIGLFAQDFLQPLAEKGLKGMMEQTMKEFTENLLLDYNKYKKEKQKNEVPSNYT